MLDLKFISENSELVKKAVTDKHENVDIDGIIALDKTRKQIIRDVEAEKAERNKTTGEIAKLKKAGQDASEMIAAMKQVGQDIAELDGKLREVEEKLNDLLLTVPNIPDQSVPVGDTEDDNVEINNWGEKIIA